MYKKVSGKLKAQEAAGHAWSNLKKIWHDALIETAKTLLGSDNSDGVKDPLVFVAHALHFVDLEPAAKNITVEISFVSRSISRVPYRGNVQV